MSIRRSSFARVPLSLCFVAIGLVGHAQVAKPTVDTFDPENGGTITSINGDTGIVTARVTATHRALAFKVTDAAVLRSLRVGQAVGADFRSKRVSVNGLEPCCAIVTLEPEDLDPTNGLAITGINAATGLVTATTRAGQELAFKVTDAALLQALRIGQGISADYKAQRVRVYPAEACCTIVSANGAGATPLAKPAVPPAAKAPAPSTPPAAPPASTGPRTHPYEVDGVEVVLVSVQRGSGNSLMVRWLYRNTTDQPRKIGESFRGMGWSEPFSLVFDAYLLDGRTRYEVQKDEAGNLLAAKHGGTKVVTLAANQAFSAWARFPAPPATTTTITVFLPGTEPFEEVAIGGAGLRRQWRP